MINTSNFTSKDNPTWPPAEPARPVPAALARTASSKTSSKKDARPPRLGQFLLIAAGLLLSWLAAVPRRLGDRLFAVNDNEAYWRGWQITRVHGGLGRCYRDPLFDTLAECPKCRGAGCVPCLGTGRITVGEVS